MKRNAGFTLIEVIASLVLLGILGAMTYGLLENAVESSLYATTMTKEAAEMKPLYDIVGTMLSDIVDLSCTNCCFTSNTKLVFRNSNDKEVTVQKGAGNIFQMSSPAWFSWPPTTVPASSTNFIVDSFQTTASGGHVKSFTLTVSYEKLVLGQQLDRPFVFEFSPRTYVTTGSVKNCP